MQQLPLEILVRITSHLSVTEAARVRKVSSQWNKASLISLSKLRVIYYADDRRDWWDLAPWIEPHEFYRLYRRQECNTVYSSRPRGLSPQSMKQLITFASKYLTSIEAFVCNHYIPFEHFAHELGSKMRFFTGKFGYDWQREGYDILKLFPRLEQFPLDSYHPCFIKQLEYLPLKALSYTREDKCSECAHFLLGQHFQRGKRLKGLPCHDKHSELETCSCGHRGLDASFTKNIKYIHIEAGTIDIDEPTFIFAFPNLEQFYADFVDIAFDHFYESLSYSTRLKQLFFETLHPDEAISHLMPMLPKFSQLQLLVVACSDSIPAPKGFIRTLVVSCEKLKRIQLPFNDLDWVEGFILRSLRHLKYFECAKVTEDFLIRYLTGLHPEGPRDLTMIHGHSPHIASITRQELHEIIGELFLTGRLTKITTNYFDFDCKSKTCIVKQVLALP